MSGPVRTLGPDDWALLRALRLACLLDAPDAFGSTHARERDQDEHSWRERLAESTWFVADAGGEPAGLVRGTSHAGAAQRRYLHSMWVHPAHRGAGVGAALITAVRRWAVVDGASELALWVVEGNASAAALYAREGFVPTGVRQRLPSNPAVDEVQWVLRLDGLDDQ